MGKITVIKAFALPKLIYPFTVLLDLPLPKEVIQKLNSVKDTSQEKLKSEVKWTNDFRNYYIVWDVAYQMAHDVQLI